METKTPQERIVKTDDRETVRENGITITQPQSAKPTAKHNPKLSVIREFVLATVHACAKDHKERQLTTETGGEEGTTRPFLACDLIAQSGLAGLQWKKHVGEDVHVTLGEQRNPQPLQDSAGTNGLTCFALPLDPRHSDGSVLPAQTSTEVHLAQCDPCVLMLMEFFDFVFVDPRKNPSPYFSSLFRNVRNEGVVCLLVPDSMQFARSPHVVRRCYGASCIKTEYMKELAVRIIMATLATEAAKCNKGLTLLYSVSLEDFLLLGVRVVRGPRQVDLMLPSVGHALHCRICEERGFYPSAMAPLEEPYSMIDCECRKNVPGKTGVVLGPLWKGSIFDYTSLSKLAAAGKSLQLSHAFFTLLQRVMEDCLCDTPPTLLSLKEGLCRFPDDDDVPPSTTNNNLSGSTNGNGRHNEQEKSLSAKNGVESSRENNNLQQDRSEKNCVKASSENDKMNTSQENLSSSCTETGAVELSSGDKANERKDRAISETKEDRVSADGDNRAASVGIKRAASSPAASNGPAAKQRRLKWAGEPTPCFYYNLHSKRLGNESLPKQQAIVQRLRAAGYRCCRTHFEKYAIRTNASLRNLNKLLGAGESSVLYVKGGNTQEESHQGK